MNIVIEKLPPVNWRPPLSYPQPERTRRHTVADDRIVASARQDVKAASPGANSGSLEFAEGLSEAKALTGDTQNTMSAVEKQPFFDLPRGERLLQFSVTADEEKTLSTGLSIGHTSPHQCEELRIVDNSDATHQTARQLNVDPIILSRLDGGMVYLGGGESGIKYVPDVQATIDDRPGELEYYPGASFIRARRPRRHFVRSARAASRRARGAVSGFSRKSRNRLLQNLAKLNRAHLPLFVTLTYPGVFPIHPDEWKRHLDKFSKRFRRRFPTAGFIWKLEPQQRGAPHFHLLVWDVSLSSEKFCALLRGWIKDAWFEVVDSGDERHRRAGTDVQVVRSWSGVMYYASKYMGKPVAVDDDAWGRPGRWWGAVGRENIPFAEKLTAWLTTGEVNDLIRWIRRFRNLDGRDMPSAWAVVESPSTWAGNIKRSAATRQGHDPLVVKNFA